MDWSAFCKSSTHAQSLAAAREDANDSWPLRCTTRAKPPAATSPRESNRVAERIMPLDVSLAMNIVLSTPLVMLARYAGTIPLRDPRRATWAAAWDIAARRGGGTVIVARSRGGSAAEGSRPRRVSRVRSRLRARTSRLDTVPTGTPRIRAVSLWVLSSRSQRTTTARNDSGSLLNSSSSIECSSSSGPSIGALAKPFLHQSLPLSATGGRRADLPGRPDRDTVKPVGQ